MCRFCGCGVSYVVGVWLCLGLVGAGLDWGDEFGVADGGWYVGVGLVLRGVLMVGWVGGVGGKGVGCGGGGGVERWGGGGAGRCREWYWGGGVK